MWQKTYEEDKAWQAALSYCENLDYAGYSDWRLPNKNELASLINYEKSGSPYSDFPDMPSSDFWSSSTRANSNNHAWTILFYDGELNSRTKGGVSSVRCVRGGN